MLDMNSSESNFHTLLDEAEVVLSDNFERFDPPTTHHFVPGFYIRQITMPEGFCCTTKIHGKRHPFVISKGKVWVRAEDGQVQLLEAPYVGITEAGTRRILLCETETVWTTMHETEKMDIEKLVTSIEEEIMIPREHLVAVADSLNRQPETSLQ
jgi:hypothetical protein